MKLLVISLILAFEVAVSSGIICRTGQDEEPPNSAAPTAEQDCGSGINTCVLEHDWTSTAKTSSDRRLYKCGTAAQTGKKCAMSGLKHTCVWVGTNKYKECDCQDTEAWPEPEDTDNGSNRLMSISIPIVTMTSAFFVLCNV